MVKVFADLVQKDVLIVVQDLALNVIQQMVIIYRMEFVNQFAYKRKHSSVLKQVNVWDVINLA